MDDALNSLDGLDVLDELCTCLVCIAAVVLGICNVVIKELAIDLELIDQILEGLVILVADAIVTRSMTLVLLKLLFLLLLLLSSEAARRVQLGAGSCFTSLLVFVACPGHGWHTLDLLRGKGARDYFDKIDLLPLSIALHMSRHSRNDLLSVPSAATAVRSLSADFSPVI